MKNFSKIILTLFLVFSLAIAVFASTETVERSFDLNYNTGIITLNSTSSLKLYEPQDIVNDDSIIIKSINVEPEISDLKLTIEGHVNWSNTIVTNEYHFVNYTNEACTTLGKGQYWKLNIKSEIATIGELLATIYDTIYGIKIEAIGSFTTSNSDVYNSWGNTTFKTDEFQNFDLVKDFTYNTKVGEYIKQAIGGLRTFEFKNKYVVSDYPFLANTDVNNDNLATRNEIIKLSYLEFGKGSGIEGFENLTDQVVDFFNKKTNGKITFKVTTAPAVEIGEWVSGGITSTQTGILSTNRQIATDDIIGLFFNYNSTGSLVSLSTINKDGTIVFDITDILDALGYTTYNITNIYYGLIGGAMYDDKTSRGYKIENVTLSYDYEVEDEADIEEVEPVTETEAEVEDEEVVDIVETETIEVTTEVVTEVTENTTEVTETVQETPDAVLDEDTTAPIVVVTSDDSDDENPRTGTLLALSPLCVTSLLIALSYKKRK